MADRAGRIVGGRGTHNRPWIVDDDDAAAPGGDAASQQQQTQQQQTQQQPFRVVGRTNSGRRASTSDIASVASTTSSGSSYDRYLAHRRAEAAANASLNSRSAHGSSGQRNSSNTAAPRPVVVASVSRQRQASSGSDRDRQRRATYTSNSYQDHQIAAAASIPSPEEKRRIAPSQNDTSKKSFQQPSRSSVTSISAARRLISPPPSQPGDAPASHPAARTGGASSSRRQLSKGAAAEEEGYSMSSRDLRARRLSQQRLAVSNAPAGADVGPSSGRDALNASMRSSGNGDAAGLNSSSAGDSRVPLHFQAHDAAVEKYLMRSRLTDAGKSRAARHTTAHAASSGGRPPSSLAVAARPTTAPVSARAPRGSGDAAPPPARAIGQGEKDRNATTTANSSQKPNSHASISGGADQKAASRATETPEAGALSTRATSEGHSVAALDPPAASGWSTLKRASTTGHSNMTTEAVAAHEAYRAETAAAAAARVAVGSGSSKVDQYLAKRNALKQRASSFSRLGKKKSDLAVSTEISATMNIASAPSTTVSLEGDESSECDSENEIVEEVFEEEESEENLDGKQWSVKVCVISAVNFPASVVPNLPFSPFLKVGLVELKATDENPQGVDGASSQALVDHGCMELTSLIERDGITSIPGCRVRCTSSKILSKRDNGSVEFHEEMRWDRITQPQRMVLAVELSSRAVLPPANSRESPPQQKTGPFQLPASPHHSIGRGHAPHRISNHGSNSDPGGSVLSSLFRNIRKSDSAEMEEANAAAAVAKLLVQGVEAPASRQAGPSNFSSPDEASFDHRSEIDVKLRQRRRRKTVKMTEELRLGAKVMPLTRLPLSNAMNGNETVRIEQWFELNTTINAAETSQVGASSALSSATRNPSVLVEISFSAPDVLNDSEDDMDEDCGKVGLNASYSKRASIKTRSQLKNEVKPLEEKSVEPMLEPGIIDYICVVGARDIGDQKADDGSRGWVNSTPECCVLEQFPPNDEFHAKNGRSAVLPGKVEWFCFPEGCRLWRGLTPPNHDELNLKRFSASSPAQVSTAIASFDACLGCTTSFSWFAISSNSDRYGSESTKTYGAVIRFYVPAPTGIDPTQDDFGQTNLETPASETGDMSDAKRLWVPIGICMTAGMPIVGAMEVMLLRLCENLSSTGVLSATSPMEARSIHEALASVIVSFQKPITGVVNCSFPFLEGERLHVTLPPRTGLPALPHGNSVASVCRLLGADGLNYLLAAFLTECKILLHSDEVANLSMVAEVMTSLLYPFQWALPYVPVLPAEMMEFIEAPVSFLLGVPSCNLVHLDPSILEDIVVVDLDRDFTSSEFFDGWRSGHKTKTPVPLPAAVASNIAKAVYRLIRAEEDVEESLGASNYSGARSFPRLEPESLPEREFRLSVALEVCGLIRSFDECLVFSSSQPVFNVDKFLQLAPSIFEGQRGSAQSSHGIVALRNVISPRSRRFVSILVCCQHFHQLLEVLESDSLSFFHLIMRSLQAKSAKKDSSLAGMLLSLDSSQTVIDLCKKLQNVEDKIPSYRVKSYGSKWPATYEVPAKCVVATSKSLFPVDLLQQIAVDRDSQQKETGADGVKSVSLEYLVELEKNPWRYQRLLNLKACSPDEESSFPAIEKIKIREAIGDRRYRAWKSGYDKFDYDEASVLSEEMQGLPISLDLRSLLASVAGDMTSTAESSQMSEASNDEGARDRDTLRRCLESAKVSSRIEKPNQSDAASELIAAAENALQNPSAKKFLLAVLSKRAGKNEFVTGESATGRRRSLQAGGSKLDAGVFEVLVRLAFAMLDSCDEGNDFESAYSLLNLSAGLYAAIAEVSNDVSIVYLTERIGLHPIYAVLELWEKVKDLHASAKQPVDAERNLNEGDRTSEQDDEYEAAVATLYEMNGYGIPAEELARFASMMCDCNDWFHSEKGQTLLMLAKRVCIRRDHGPVSATPSKKGDMELIGPSSNECMTSAVNLSNSVKGASVYRNEEYTWVEVGWCHPAAQSSRRAGLSDNARRPAHTLMDTSEDNVSQAGNESSNYMRRSAVTSMAYLGSSVVVTGGLDGGVFMARKVRPDNDSGTKFEGIERCDIRGVHLDWGSSGSRYNVGSASASLDGEYGVGAVTCLAATRSVLGLSSSKSMTKDVVGPLEDHEVLDAMEGIRVVAGTTCGDLRVWSVKDVFSAVFFANSGGEVASPTYDPASFQQGAGGTSSTFVNGKRRGGTDFAAGSSLTRLKFSLRGRALSGHRGGVSCIDVHSNIYRPDSIISGGADGLIKLWSLRTPGSSGGRRSSTDPTTASLLTSTSPDALTSATKAARGGDALSILSGHGGRILCVKTAWHGDRLISGGADRTVRLWDLAGSGGKCLISLSGHVGWVTAVQYWGPNTIISASTDRSVALWDVRVGTSPLYTLRHHHAPVSDLFVGPRSDPVMISAGIDGSVAAWDFRRLTGSSSPPPPPSDGSPRHTQVVRIPAVQLNLHAFNRKQHALGPVRLSKGASRQRRTVFCVGSDAVVREWDYRTGAVVSEHATGHCDSVSAFVALAAGDKVLDTRLESAGPDRATSTITASWDGTVRLRSLVARK